MIRSLVYGLTLVGVASLGATPVAAQHALVLSGGGARGLAHIGAIEYLNQQSYDPDIVVGTSMGAVVGALYAAGYSADEIKARVLAIRWSEVFDATPVVVGPHRELHVPAFNSGIDVGDLRTGIGLFGQWRVNRALANLLFEANARSRGDFDLLPRRYRAVAADLQTGERVVLARGDLARAVRASMAYPGFFAPVRWDGRLLTDGGIIDNFPVSVARDLGATHVVGVDVGRAPAQIRSLSPMGVIDRSLRLMQQNLARGGGPDELVLPVITQEFAGPSFPEDPRPLMELGYAAAQHDLASFRASARTTPRSTPDLPERFSELRIEAADSALAAFARNVYDRVAASRYDSAAVSAATDRLFSSGLFNGVWPRVVPAADSAAPPLLVVRVEAPPRLMLSGNAHYENDRGGRVWLSLHKQDRIGMLPTVFGVAGSVGSLERWGTASVRIHLRTPAALAWSMGAHAAESSVRLFDDDALSSTDVLRLGGWLGFEFPHILRVRLLTLTAHAEWIDIEDGRSGSALGPLVRYSAVAAQARPVGWPFLAEAERRWGDLAYTRIALRASHVVGRRGPQMAIGFDVRAVSSAAPIDVRPALGDEHAIPGLRWGEARGRARVVTGVDLAHPLGSGFIRLRARTGAVTEELDQWRGRWETGGQLGFFMRTPIGVVEAGYGIATRGDGRFDVSVGRDF